MGTPDGYSEICIKRDAAAELSFAERYKWSPSLGQPARRNVNFYHLSTRRPTVVECLSHRGSSCNRYIRYISYIGRGDEDMYLKNRPFISFTRAHGRFKRNFKRKWNDDAGKMYCATFHLLSRDTFLVIVHHRHRNYQPRDEEEEECLDKFVSRTRRPNSKHARLA